MSETPNNETIASVYERKLYAVARKLEPDSGSIQDRRSLRNQGYTYHRPGRPERRYETGKIWRRFRARTARSDYSWRSKKIRPFLPRDHFSKHLNAQPLSQRPTYEDIDDPERIKRVVKALIGSQSRGQLNKDGADPQVVQAAKFEPKESFPIHWEVTGPVPSPPFTMEVTGYNSVYQFSITKFENTNGLMATEIPKRITRKRYRGERRVKAPDGMMVSFKHPVIVGLEIRRQVKDLSYSGLSFETEVQEDALFLNRELPEVKIEQDGEIIWKGSASTGRVNCLPLCSSKKDSPKTICGVKLSHRSNESRTQWYRQANKYLHPNTRTGATWSEHSWEVFDKSGYFKLSGKTPAHFNTLKKSFARVSRLLDAAPHIGCQAVWPSDRGIEATLSATRIYQGTWLIHQLAVANDLKANSRLYREALFASYCHTFEYVHATNGSCWALWYAEDKRWNKLAHKAFVTKQCSTGKVFLKPFRLMETSCSGPQLPQLEGLEIGSPSPEEIGDLLSIASQNKSKQYIEALDLCPSRFDMQNIKKIMDNAGFCRERRVIVARQSGEPVAAAILEAGDNAMNLFRLYDSVRLFSMVDDGQLAYPILIEEARTWYRKRNKEAFVCFVEDNNIETLEVSGFSDLGRGEMTVISVDIIPEFLEHIYLLSFSKDRKHAN